MTDFAPVLPTTQVEPSDALAFIALGDIHLDSTIWRRYRQIQGDAFVGFTSFINTAIRLRIPAVILGDLFDSVDPEPDLVRYFREEMDRCRDNQIPVYAIQGNHDKRPSPWYTSVHNWPQHIGDGVQVEIGGVSVVGFDYAPLTVIRKQLEDLGAKRNKPQAVFLHQCVRQTISFEGAWNCDLEWVPPEIPLILMGDIHIPVSYVIRPNQRAYYTGPSHARDISQIGDKSATLVYRDLQVMRVPIAHRRIAKFVILTPEGVGEAAEWLRMALATPQPLPPVAWIYHTVDTTAPLAALANDYDGRAIVVIEPAKLTGTILDEEVVVTVDQLLSKESLIAKLANPETEPEIYAFVLELAKNQNVGEILMSVRERFYASLKQE